MAAKTTKFLAMQNFCSNRFSFATDHTESTFRVFYTAINISVFITLIDFRGQLDSHNYDNGQLSKNSNLWNSQRKRYFQLKLSENTNITEF